MFGTKIRLPPPIHPSHCTKTDLNVARKNATMYSTPPSVLHLVPSWNFSIERVREMGKKFGAPLSFKLSVPSRMADPVRALCQSIVIALPVNICVTGIDVFGDWF